MPASVFIEHGTTTMPSVLNEPLETLAAMLRGSWTTSAIALMSSIDHCGASYRMETCAPSERMRCVSTSGIRLSARSV